MSKSQPYYTEYNPGETSPCLSGRETAVVDAFGRNVDDCLRRLRNDPVQVDGLDARRYSLAQLQNLGFNAGQLGHAAEQAAEAVMNEAQLLAERSSLLRQRAEYIAQTEMIRAASGDQ